jgi:hypothetical protein
MLSLPRANYLTSAAAGLPLMLVRLLAGCFVHGSDLCCRLHCVCVQPLENASPQLGFPPRSQSFGAISTWTIYLANSLYVEAKRRKVCSQSRIQSSAVVLQ